MFVLIEVLISLQIKQGPGVRMYMYVATYVQYSEPYTHQGRIQSLERGGGTLLKKVEEQKKKKVTTIIASYPLPNILYIK